MIQNIECDPQIQSSSVEIERFSSERAFDEWMREERKTLKCVKFRTYAPKPESIV